MGHCDSSTQLGRNAGVFGVAGGAVETDAAVRAANARRITCETGRVTSPQLAANTNMNTHTGANTFARARTFGAWSLLAFVQFYKVFFSPFLGGACKFYPSCSNYAQEAIELHGARRGAWLALKRLGRCRPFTKGGFDPVPDAEDLDAEWLRSDARWDASAESKERAQ
jgi:putative membrane protein insertion efficiency factor